MTHPERSFELPPHLAEAIAISSAAERFPCMFMPTFHTAIARFGAFTELGDWIDMKIDPATGEDRAGRGGLYARGRVYGWIQGRGLEALCAWLRWHDATPARSPLDAGDVARVAESLFSQIAASCFPDRDGALRGGFAMSPQGQALGDDPPANPAPATASGTTLTALFLLRGLMAYASLPLCRQDAAWIVQALRIAVDAALRGQCLNDQLSFGASGGGASVGRGAPGSGSTRGRGYEGHMIALGACRLLYEHTRAPEDRDLGVRLVESVLDGHFFRNADGFAWLSDLRDAGRTLDPDPESTRPIGVNPGHIIEFAGLALQFHRIAGGIPAARRARLIELAETSWRLGRAPCGGIVRGMEGRSGATLAPHCPWWSSFETVRTFTEIFLASEDAAARARALDIIEQTLDCIDRVYLAPSETGIPVQTVAPDGRVVDFIPATPDIDPGYHTGIPLMDADLGSRATRALRAGAAEAAIPTRLGVLLQGHLARSQPADRELDPLQVRACIMEARGSTTAFISADVLEFSREWAEATCGALSALSGIPEDCIFLTATHTHTAPAAIGLGLRPADEAFLDTLRDAMVRATGAALARMQPVAGLAGTVVLETLGVNRRALDPDSGQLRMRPNPAGDRDPEIGCLYLIGRHGAPVAIFLNLAVHPTTLGVGIHAISADYPGRAAAALKRHYGDKLVVLPIQGACGDVRPAILDASGASFADGAPDDIERMGQAIADRIIAAAHAKVPTGMATGGFSWLDVQALRSASKIVDLPYFHIKSRDEVIAFRDRMRAAAQASASPSGFAVPTGFAVPAGFAAAHDNPALGADSLAAWADWMLTFAFDAKGRYVGPASERARFGFCELTARDGRSLQFFSLPGEAFSRIGRALKDAAAPSTLFICGYSGGSVGYIPTAEAFAQGGYEVEQAYMFYGRPAALDPSAESLISRIYLELRDKSML